MSSVELKSFWDKSSERTTPHNHSVEIRKIFSVTQILRENDFSLMPKKYNFAQNQTHYIYYNFTFRYNLTKISYISTLCHNNFFVVTFLKSCANNLLCDIFQSWIICCILTPLFVCFTATSVIISVEILQVTKFWKMMNFQ